MIIDRREGEYYIGRTEYDSPDVDNEVLIEAKNNYLRTGEFYQIRISDASDFDLYGQPIGIPEEKPGRKELKVRTTSF